MPDPVPGASPAPAPAPAVPVQPAAPPPGAPAPVPAAAQPSSLLREAWGALRSTLIEALDSKKAMGVAVGVLGAALLKVAPRLGIPLTPDEATHVSTLLAGLVATYVLGQSAVDAASKKEAPK